MEDLSRKRVRSDSDEFRPESDTPEVKRMKEDLLSLLDESASDPDPPTQELDSFIKIFENEIAASSPSSRQNSDSGKFKPELEASDNELKLPREELRSGETELVHVESDSSVIGEFCEFDDSILSYEPFEFGDFSTVTEYAALDGLFQCSDSPELSFRHQSLPAEDRNLSA